MFDRNRNYVLNPIELKRWVNGKFRTLSVIQTSYNPKTNYVVLFDSEDQEFYQCQYINKEFLKATKIPEEESN